MSNMLSILSLVISGGSIVIIAYLLILSIRLAKKGMKALDIYIEKNKDFID